ncbi:MAG TPA: FAD-binding oxidoreductase [Gemmatimonadales bacterium]|jgi:FAD/FMN-containing dehydrogenase|nr:FAD-binding oxidoreductase [Gemmatimonadales bacterium]
MDVVSDGAIRDFAASLQGALVRPSDPGYESARRIWNARFDRRPGLIVRCADAADVKHAVDFARAENVLVAIRGGGHSFAGHSTCDGGLVIDLSGLKALQVDRNKRIVDLGPGLVTAEVDTATKAADLAVVLGGCGSVGIGGFTLGGGEGALSGKYGLSCDNLLSAHIVLADGRLVTASADQNPDLFWALRGGGGNFGVVTSFRLRAHPVTEVVAGRLVYELSKAPTVLRAYRSFAPSAPDEVTCGLTFTGVDRTPALVLDLVYIGNAVSAAPMLHTVRSFAKPQADSVAPVQYHQYRLRNPGPPAGFPSTARGGFVSDLPDELIEAVTSLAADVPPAAEFEMNHLHGAVSRTPLTAAAFPLRKPGFDCFAIAGWPVPELHDAAVSWVRRLYDTLRPYASGAYINVLNEDEEDRVMAAYGPQYARLAALKKQYDPGNLFRLNPNILPGG